MEYVVARATRLTWLTLGLPAEVAQLIGFDPGGGGARDQSRSVSFLSRGRGIARVVATYPAREALAVETLRGRLIATARLGDRLLFSLPVLLAQHLELDLTPRPDHARGTHDPIAWLVPAPEYHEYRRRTDAGEPWEGLADGRLARVYVEKSLLPFPRDLAQLAEVETRIEQEEWVPGIEALQRVARPRRPPG